MKRLRYLWPGYRRAEEREMQEELAALEEIAGRRALGNLTLAAENARAVWGWEWLASLVRDVRYALRVLSRQPNFALVAVLSLGLGIGANAAIFSLMDTLLWRQLPVREPERLVHYQHDSYSYPVYREYAAKSQGVLEDVIATAGAMARDFDTGGGPERGQVVPVSGSFFPGLGVTPLLGRMLMPQDDGGESGGNAAVLSYRYWQRAYGGERSAVGRTLRVGSVPFTIVGVARPEFFGVVVGEAADAWVPLSTLPAVLPGQMWFDRSVNYLELLGRLRPGVSTEQASAALTPLAVAVDLALAPPDMPKRFWKEIREQKLKLEPAAKGIGYLRWRFSAPLRVLFAMVGIGLLLACVNVMSLGYARAEARRHELRVRLAIGAGRVRIVRQLVTEALVVALAGGAVGLAIYRPAAAGLVSLLSQKIEPRVGSDMLLYVFTISLAAGLICGLAPALSSTRRQGSAGLEHGSRGSTPPPARRAVGRTAASVQMALSVVLIAAAFLFAFSLRSLTTFDTGLDRSRLVVLDVDAKDIGYKGPQLTALHRRVLDRLSTIRGVESASFSGHGIYSGRNSNGLIAVDGFPRGDGTANQSFHDQVGPHYFATAGTPLVAGREFDERDNPAGPRVAIVNQQFVRHFFHGQNPLGKNLYRWHDERPYQIVGVVRDIRTDVRWNAERMFYMAQLQTEGESYTTRFLVRMQPGHAARIADLRAAVRAADSAVHLESIDSADDLLNRTLDADRAIAALSFGFGLLAVTLAAVGIYGLLAHDVTRRTAEIGVRVALGATRPGVMALVFREVAMVAVVGIAAGMAGTLALGRLVTGMVFGLKPGDPRVLLAAVAVIVAVAALAAWFPARRAASMDPTAALRHE